MSTPNPIGGTLVPAMPWYQSKVMVAFVTIVITQLAALGARKFGLDLSVYGIAVPDVVTWVMNTVSGLAVAYGWAGRITTAPVTLTQSKADTINAAPTIVTTEGPKL